MFNTKKTIKKYEISDPMPQRSLTARFPQGSKAGVRGTIQISSPVELVSTTNMLSYNAPDIRPNKSQRSRRAPSSASSSASSTPPSAYPSKPSSTSPAKRALSSTSSASASADDSDRYPFSEAATPVTMTDASSVGSMSPTEPEKNHLSCYFQTATTKTEGTPQVPSRASSHTKKSHEVVSRKRASSNVSNPVVAAPHVPTLPRAQHNQSARITQFGFGLPMRTSSVSGSTNPISHAPPVPDPSYVAMQLSQSDQPTQFAPSRSNSRNIAPSNVGAPPMDVRPEPLSHPYGNELARVSETAEESGMSTEKFTIAEQEEIELHAKGYCKFLAQDYINEIQGFISMAFSESQTPRGGFWV